MGWDAMAADNVVLVLRLSAVVALLRRGASVARSVARCVRLGKRDGIDQVCSSSARVKIIRRLWFWMDPGLIL